jgi:hypothetical protein
MLGDFDKRSPGTSRYTGRLPRLNTTTVGSVAETLPDSYTARAFYAHMFKAGRKPAVVFKQAG